jgi:hypothetical protein
MGEIRIFRVGDQLPVPQLLEALTFNVAVPVQVSVQLIKQEFPDGVITPASGGNNSHS